MTTRTKKIEPKLTINPTNTISNCQFTAQSGKPLDSSAIIAVADAIKQLGIAAEVLASNLSSSPGVMTTAVRIDGMGAMQEQ